MYSKFFLPLPQHASRNPVAYADIRDLAEVVDFLIGMWYTRR